ncbi:MULTISPECIES: ABC transporter substrate-binding protein [unclassified Modestobacter]|uniref:ABC transporter substrate-binding protein n=1 Tax=unclassified Modestobacter TaxID=2643866 RepID=UPI0022AB48CA|nr:MULTISPECIES: ABC transporter substrate-binding protein [unclassified Modestobacter]MCZ2811586.1 ABC transporter substrate-binding protein [Modestobacter sp. VKM Ac-2979]MCZ2843309.1 ABC transporter substrate-binding protein [Modestobacter sp. VKM Ac-2980]MCZ2848728.1 ABC transporter substrate-binding protein [Modestobacter sp. VKM Ac-2978]
MGRRTATTRTAALLAAMTLSLAACAESDDGGGGGGGGGSADETGPIKIGAVLDITGAGASLGVPERQALELLAGQLEEEGGIDGREVELIIEDNQSTEDGAAKAMNKLVNEDEVDIVLGASRTGPSLAMRPIAESTETPMISLAANQAIVEGSEWVFKTAQNDRVVIERMIDYMAEQGWSTIGLARDASGFGEGVAEMFDEIGAEQGISVVATEKFAPDATDFTAQMVNLRNAGADVNVIWGIPPAAGLAQRAYDQLGIETPVMQSHGIGNQVFLDTAGDAAEGMVAPLGRLVVAEQLPDDDPQKEIITTFIDDYTAEFGAGPSTFSGHAYDAWQLAVDALSEEGTDPQAIRDHLESVTDFTGISGVFTMTPEDHAGLSKEALALVTVENGQWQLVPDQGD